ncbi:RNA polymerase sigma factor [Planctomycetota bacterium]
MVATKKSDRSLLEAFAEGNEEAFKLFFQRYENGLFSYIYAITGNDTSAADVIHQVFFNVYQKADRYLAARNIKSYLYRSARNAALRHAANLQRERAQLQDYSEYQFFMQPGGSGFSNEDLEKLNETLARIPQPQREVIILKTYHDLTFSEIAGILNESPKTIQSRYGLGIRKLREKLT